jgi:hypothetical protein
MIEQMPGKPLSKRLCFRLTILDQRLLINSLSWSSVGKLLGDVAQIVEISG